MTNALQMAAVPGRIPDSAPGDRRDTHVLIFGVDDREYALPVTNVVEVVRMVAITPLPEASPWMLGVLNHRGRVIPVVDLRARLGIPRREPNVSTPIVISRTDTHLVGLVADDLVEVLSVSPHELEESADDDHSSVMGGVIRHGDRLVIVLDAGRLHDRSVNAVRADGVTPEPSPEESDAA